MLQALALALLLQPAAPTPPADTTAELEFDRSTGFSTVVINHINRIIGTENLPVANGQVVPSGVFVTVAADRMQVFDRDAVGLSGGRVTDSTTAQECESGCPAVLFDAFAYEWLRLAVESPAHATRIPVSVHFAVHSEVPARTLLQMAYAASETRPVLPPSLTLLVNMPGRGLRSVPFFLLPPKGLELQQGSAALGLTVEISGGEYRVGAADPSLPSVQKTKNLKKLMAILAGVKKRNPGKEAVVVVPGDDVSVADLVAVIRVLQVEFPFVVLSQGQDVYI